MTPANTASITACVPHSNNASSRSCGLPPVPTRPNASWFAGVSATSSPVPSQATSRRPNANVPGVPAAASGPFLWANSSRSGSAPRRRRALVNAGLDGTTHPCRWRNPLVSHRITDRYPGGPMLSAPLNRHNANTKYTTDRAGNNRERRSIRPAAATTRSTSSGPISAVRTPSRTGNPRSRAGASDASPGGPDPDDPHRAVDSGADMTDSVANGASGRTVAMLVDRCPTGGSARPARDTPSAAQP